MNFDDFDPDALTLHYKLDGHEPVPCTLLEWARTMEDPDSRKVGYNKFGDVVVSTVFLGLDHSFQTGEHVPILFETIIFGGAHDDYQERYATWAEAEAGHAIAVEMVKSSIRKEIDRQFLPGTVLFWIFIVFAVAAVIHAWLNGDVVWL